jgi:hypothetical protein
METIGNTAQRLIRYWSTQRQNKEEDIIRRGLRRLLTKQEQRHITRYLFKDTRIILYVDSSAWLYQLNLKKEQLIQYLNQAPRPDQAITEIILRLDRNEAKGTIKN